MPRKDIVVRVAGEGGEGVISVATILARSAAAASWRVFTFRSYPAEIKGGLAMMQVRINTREIHSIGMDADVLMAFNQEAVDTWGDRMTKNGVLLYDPKHCEIPDDYPHKTIPVPLHDTSMAETGGRISKNIVALAALLQVTGIPSEETREQLRLRFKHKGDEVVEKNDKAFDAGLKLMADLEGTDVYRLKKPSKLPENKIIISGNQALSMGTIAAGCRYAAGYPITPATPVLEFLMKYLPGFGGNVVQAEDEIAALSSCLGASFAGVKSMTATSGPGLCLMSELIGLASMSEIPIVIVDVQRSGPGTGMPTKTEQSDLMYAIHGTAGEAPRIVIAPTSIEDCFYQAINAFNLAERYQMPVILLSDQSMAYRTQSLDIPEAHALQVETRAKANGNGSGAFMRYRVTDTGVSPTMVPGMENGMYVATGLEHDELGAPNYTPENREKMMAKRYRKLETLADELDRNGNGIFNQADGAKIGVIGWGSTEGPILEAIERARKEDGKKVAHFHPKVLMPLAMRKVEAFLKPLDKIIVFEENHTAQFSKYLRSHFPIQPIEVTKCTGLPFSGDEVYEALKEHL